MSSTIRNLLVNISVNLKGADVGFKKMSRNLQRAGRQMQTAGKSLTKGLSVPLLAAGVASIKFGIEFEDGMAKVNTILDTSTKSLKEFEEEIITLSNTTGEASTELTEGLYQAISAGADTADVMDLMAVAAKSARGGFTDTATAVDGLTSVLNSYGMATRDASDIANLFFVTQKKGKTTFGELAQSIGNVAPLAKVAGVSVESLLASIASLTANGLETTVAITGVRTALTNIIKPTADAAKVAKELGIDFSTSALKSKGFVAFLDEIKEKTGGSADIMAKLFGNVRGLNAVLSLTSDVGMSKMLETLDEMETNITAVDDAFNIMNDTVGNQLKKALNVLKNVSIELSQRLMPILTNKIIPAIVKVAESLSKMLDKFDKMSDIGKGFTKLGLIIAVSIGPALIIVGKLVASIGVLIGRIAVAKAASLGFAGSMSLMLGPAGLVTVALVALAAIIGTIAIVYSDATKETREFIKKSDELIESSRQLRNAHKKTNDELATSEKKTKKLVDEMIQLNKKEKLSVEEKARLKSIALQLNEMYIDLNLTINKTTGLLDNETKAIKETVKAQKEKIRAVKNLDDQSETLTKIIELEDDLEESTLKVADAYGRATDGITDTWIATVLMNSAAGSNRKLLVSYGEIRDELRETNKEYDLLIKKYGDMETSITESNESITTSTILTTEQLQAMADLVILNAGGMAESAKLTKEEFDRTAQAQQNNITLTKEQLDTMFSLYEESYIKATENYDQFIAGVESATQKHFDAMGGYFDEFQKDQETSVEEMQKIQQDKIGVLAGFRDNLMELKARVSEDGKAIVDDGLIAELAQMGPKGVEEAKALLEMTDTELKKYVKNTQSLFKESADLAVFEIEQLTPKVAEVMDDINDELRDTNEIKASGLNLGSVIDSSVELGMIRGMGTLMETARRVARAALGSMRAELQSKSPSKKAMDIGETIPQGFAMGIMQKTGLAIKAAASMANQSLGGISGTPALAMAGGMMNNAGMSNPFGVTVNINGLLVAENDLGEVVGHAVVSKLRALGVDN